MQNPPLIRSISTDRRTSPHTFQEEFEDFKKALRISLVQNWTGLVYPESVNSSRPSAMWAPSQHALLKEIRDQHKDFLKKFTTLVRRYPNVRPMGLELVFDSLGSQIEYLSDSMKFTARKGPDPFPRDTACMLLHILLRSESNPEDFQKIKNYFKVQIKEDFEAAYKRAEQRLKELSQSKLYRQISLPSFHENQDASWTGKTKETLWRAIYQPHIKKSFKKWTRKQMKDRSETETFLRVMKFEPYFALDTIQEFAPSTKRFGPGPKI